MADKAIALEFMEACARAKNAREVARLLYRALESMGYIYVACSSHVDPMHPPRGAVSMVNYPAEWLARFSERNYAATDPVFMGARRLALPFQWDELVRTQNLERGQRRILEEAASFGIKRGATIPIHAPGALAASCSVVPGPDGVDPLNFPNVLTISLYAHESARRLLKGDLPAISPHLTVRERQCLALAGRGKSDWAIGELLGINGRTVHNTIERAKRRYGVSHRIQAVVVALFNGQIQFDDLSDP